RVLRFSSLFSESARACVTRTAGVTAAPAPTPSTRRKSRRPTLALLSCFIASLPEAGAALGRQRESFRFNVNKHPADHRYSPVEVRSLATLQVGEETSDPGRHVLLEDDAVGAGRRRQLSARQAGHDLAQDAGMVLGL